jgi:hypothetical protein
MLIVFLKGDQLTGYELISVSVFIFVLLKFINDLGTRISIKNIIALLMVMQCLIGSILGYAYNDNIEFSYQMKVEKSVYFSYILPATIAFMIGLYLKLRREVYRPNFKSSVDHYQKGIILITIGFLFDFLPWFGFLGYLLEGLKYIGVFYMVLSPNKNRYFWIAFVFGYLFLIRSLGSGMFHEMLLWSCFLIVLIFYFNRKSFLFRFGIIFSGFFFVFILQLVKPEYRSKLNENAFNDRYSLFFNLLAGKLLGDEEMFSNEAIANNVTRLNQGWIISNVMDNIPAHHPYANGQTLKDAIVASVFPRFLFPSKPMAGGQSNMKNYAGITLNENTSMDISQVGEAYANFGVMGGILMMFCLGLFSNLVISFVERKCLYHPELILWLPLLYLQVVKAETSLVTVLNHLVKASLLTWFFFSPWGYKILNHKFNRWKFGIRTFRLSAIGGGSKGLRKRKGLKFRKGYTTFEDRVKGKRG